jgi:Uncharacterized alpha/beta hydrolase domain (DUF2235)
MQNIILLSDGTGNSAAKVWRTNVWRLFQSLELKGSNQIAIYDDGVGTSSFLPLAILGGAFGWGLKRNVRELYKFLCRNYQDGDRIYGFGFSRGAFTIRVLIGLILNQGLVKFSTEAELDKKAKAAYRAYRHARYPALNLQYPYRLIRTSLDRRFYKPCERKVDQIEFLGLWDAVPAYGLPIGEMTKGVNNWIWPLELPSTEFLVGLGGRIEQLLERHPRDAAGAVSRRQNDGGARPGGQSISLARGTSRGTASCSWTRAVPASGTSCRMTNEDEPAATGSSNRRWPLRLGYRRSVRPGSGSRTSRCISFGSRGHFGGPIVFLQHRTSQGPSDDLAQQTFSSKLTARAATLPRAGRTRRPGAPDNGSPGNADAFPPPATCRSRPDQAPSCAI